MQIRILSSLWQLSVAIWIRTAPLNLIQNSKKKVFMLLIHQFILVYFFNEIISCFIYIFQSKFLTYILTYIYHHIFSDTSMLVVKPTIFNISIYFSWNILLCSSPHLLQTIERLNVFLKNLRYFMVFKFSIFIANNLTDFYQFCLFRIYWKHLNTIFSFFSYSLGKNNL